MKKIKNTSLGKFKKENKLRMFNRNQIHMKYSRDIKRSLSKINNLPVRSSAFSKFQVYDIVTN